MDSFDPLIAEKLDGELPLRGGLEPAWDDVLTRAESPRPRHARLRQGRRWPVIAAATAVLMGILLVSPAWGLVRDVLPFEDQPSAPSSVKVDFSQMGVGAPAGMSPEAVSGDAREIEQVTLGGEERTLWVAPATGRFGFCWLWTNLAGSCGSATQPLGVLWMASKDDPEAPQLVTGYAISPTVSDVSIRFNDGTSVDPHIVWVSAPINAGFFDFEVPADRQSSQDHVTAIHAYDANGKLVGEQTLAGS